MRKGKYFEKTLSTRWFHKGRIVSLREDLVKLPDGRTSKREIVLHPGAVAVVALTKENKMVFVKQFRKPTGEELLEIPAGLARKGESFKDAAGRELEEETGCRAKNIKPVLSAFSSPGYSSEVIRYFFARGLIKTRQGGDRDEFIDVKVLSVPKAMKMVFDGKIKDNKTIIGIFLAARWINTQTIS